MRSDWSANTSTTIAAGCGSAGTSDAGCGNSAIRPFCLCGMIIKITSNTSRTSINGTTFISTKIPRFEPPTDMPMSHLVGKFPRGGLSHPREQTTNDSSGKQTRRILLTGLELGGDQSNFVDAGATHDVNGAGDFAKQDVAITLNEGDFFGTILKDLFNARTEIIPGGVFVIDLDLAVSQHLNNHRLILKFLILLLVGIRLRHQSIHPLRGQRGDNHENDQQHQQNVD